jgi:GNAT superfamily N-acetyltransferase
LSPVAPKAEPPHIRWADARDIESVIGILREAALWLERTGRPMWRDNELIPERLAAEVREGCFIIAVCEGEAAGALKLQLQDTIFWPDIPQEDSLFVRRLAVRRHFAGGGVSVALLRWAAEHARALDRTYLRLDCEASRTKLRAFYERFGFRHHSDRQAGPYFVSRYQYDLATPLNSSIAAGT